MKVKFPTCLASPIPYSSMWTASMYDGAARFQHHVSEGSVTELLKPEAQRIARNARRRLRYAEKKLERIKRALGPLAAPGQSPSGGRKGRHESVRPDSRPFSLGTISTTPSSECHPSLDKEGIQINPYFRGYFCASKKKMQKYLTLYTDVLYCQGTSLIFASSTFRGNGQMDHLESATEGSVYLERRLSVAE